ncbi:MAG: hypothetical protein M3478_11255 [Planctomycetota bacterium]|nr:hypothetical protein [Planctomycetota bacterium]
MRAFPTGFWALGLLLTVAALAGCDRADDGGAAGDTYRDPTTTSAKGGAGAATGPSTSPATTQAAAESMINIDGNLVLFPGAKLRIDEADGKTVARLFSDDPKGAALDENYEGNSFYLQIELDADEVQTGDAKNLNGVELTYKAPSSERDDTPYGIFLEGRRWVLQPADVRVAFGAASPLDVRVTGVFLMFDSNDPTVKPKRAQVVAKLSAAMQTKK